MKMPARLRNSWFVMLLLLLCFAPSALGLTVHDSDKNRKKCRDCKVAAAEGGSAGLYLLLAGASCLGALRFRSRQEAQDVKSVQ